MFDFRIVVNRTCECNKKTFHFYIFEKMFCSVAKNRLWKCLREEFGADWKLRRAIPGIYEVCKYNVRTEFGNGDMREEISEFVGDMVAYADDFEC